MTKMIFVLTWIMCAAGANAALTKAVQYHCQREPQFRSNLLIGMLWPGLVVYEVLEMPGTSTVSSKEFCEII